MAASVENRLFNRVERGCNVPPPMNPVDPFMSRLKNSPAMFQEDSSSDEEDWEWSDLKRESSAADDLEPSILDKRDQGTADSWVLRHPSLIRLTGKHPFNSEPPLSRLMQHGFITPTQLHYVRNHGPVPRATWHEWTVEVCGLVKRPARFTMDQLVSEFPSREFPVTLVCAGNRRKEQNMVKQTVGFNWGPSAVSTSVWRGVPLRCILKRCGIPSRRRGALNVCFEGAEDLPGGGGSKYGTSLRKEIAMDPSRDILVAYLQNGERLAPDHGFPVRIIIPGFIGGRMVKWLRRIIVTTPESDSYYHFNDNRVLPSHVDAELANSQAWWYKPEYIINELNINSVITTPSHDEILHINAWTAQRPYTLRGYAYSGGGKKVTRVEVTTDGGESWHVCEVERPEKPNKYGKYWCWCFWRVDVEVVDLIRAKEIAVRAWDETHNTQPENLTWNLMGMMNNCWYRVKASLLREVGIRFEHPIQAGNQPGGWMTSQKPLPNLPEPTHAAPKKSVPSNSYSLSELSKHNSAESAWIAVHGHVYDCTRFLKDHPGGTDSILINAGTDCTEEFDSIHSDKAKKLLQDFRVGDLITEASPPTTKETSSVARRRRSSALIPREKIQCRLESKVEVTRDVRRFRFALPDPDQVLGLPVGKHIFLCATVHGKPCMRAYTPTSVCDEIGHFELVVKVYFPGENPKFPSGGAMSQYLESLPVGSKLDVKGPTGHIEYAGRGVFTVHGKPRRARRLAMIAGGTGITPIYQVIQAVLGDPSDETEMFLVYANRTEEDILLWDELEEWAGRSGGRLKVWYVVGESVRERWKYSLGFVTDEILRDHVPEASEGTLALACGPPPMIKFAVAPGLEKMGYDVKESLLVF